MIKEDKFNFFVPVEFEKAKGGKEQKEMIIKGIASTPDKDSEGEELIPIGFDLSRFLSIGFINWNHKSKDDASKIIGEPLEAYVNTNGDLFVKGKLYTGHPLAESVYNLAETLEHNGSNRKLAYSIEGRAIERDPINPKRITRALITGLAITPTPVNGKTYLDICKGTQKEDWTEYDNDVILKSENPKYIFEFECNDKRFGITKSFDVEEIDKAMDIASTQVLVPESLDKKPKVLEPIIKKAILEGIIPLEKVIKLNKR